MRKDRLTAENIKSDLLQVAKQRERIVSNWRLSFIVPLILLAIFLGWLLKSIWIGLLPFSIAAYHIVRWVISYRHEKDIERALKRAIERCDFSVSMVTLRSISEDIIYEPHLVGTHGHVTKTVKVFYFESDESWRVPSVWTHYPWSENYDMSTRGLENTSIVGDMFYYIRLQADYKIGYIYNTKLFDLDQSVFG